MKSWKKVELLTKRIDQLEKQLNDVNDKIESDRHPNISDRLRQFWSRIKIEKEKRPVYQLVAVASGCAIILGIAIFFIVQNYQWQNAISQIRSEPGIEILSVERAGFLKKRIVGLRDPLAKNVPEILAKNGIDPVNVEVFLTEYHSLNTPFAEQRKDKNDSNASALRDSLVEAVGEFMRNSDHRREADLERITRSLFEIRFPEEMKTVELERTDSIWQVKGELLEPAFSNFKTEAPKFIFSGKLHFDKLKNITAIKTSSLRKGIESLNLFARSQEDGSLVYLQRIQRLVSDYDAVCRESEMPLPALQILVRTDNPKDCKETIESIKTTLEELDTVTGKRFFPLAVTTADKENTEPSGTLTLIPLPSSP